MHLHEYRPTGIQNTNQLHTVSLPIQHDIMHESAWMCHGIERRQNFRPFGVPSIIC